MPYLLTWTHAMCFITQSKVFFVVLLADMNLKRIVLQGTGDRNLFVKGLIFFPKYSNKLKIHVG